MTPNSSPNRIAVERLAATDHGAFLRAVAYSSGMTKIQIDRRIRRGQWKSGPSRTTLVVSSLDAGPLTWLRAANLGLGAVAWGASAIALHGLGLHPRQPTIAAARRTRSTVYDVMTIADLDDTNHTTRSGVRVVGLPMALASMAATLAARDFDDLVDEALRQQLTTWERLEAQFTDFARPGRAGSRLLRSTIADRSIDAVVPLSIWSRDVAKKLGRSGLHRPTMEHRVVDQKQRLVAQVDLAFVEEKVAIELDSVSYHLNREAFETDRRRDADLARQGWRVLRFTWDQCTKDWPWVANTVRASVLAS